MLSSYSPTPLKRQERNIWRPQTIVRLLLALTLLLMASVSHSGISSDELKAAFIVRFADFVTWPETRAGGSVSAPFALCVYGDSPVEEWLKDSLAHGKMAGRPVQIHHLSKPEAVGMCDLVYIPANSADDLEKILSAARNKPVLTVSDVGGASDHPGLIIRFFNEGDRLGFEIRPVDARNSQLQISAQLLRLARIVE